jgi:hypothetical protein
MNTTRNSTVTPSALRQLPVSGGVRLAMLNNPLSGGNRKDLQKIRRTAAAMLPEVLQREVQTPEDVAASLADFARREVRLIIINGGDGTVQATLTAIFQNKYFETLPLLAVLPSAGTTSMIAGDVGLKGSRRRALQRLYRWVHTKNDTGCVIQRPVLKVQVPSEKKPVYGMFFGAAGIYQASHFCNQKIHARGVRGEKAAGAALVRFLLAVLLKDHKMISAVPITACLNENPATQQKYLLLFVTSLQRLFLGLRPYWGSEAKPLHYTAIEDRPRHLLRAVPSLIRGRQGRLIKPANGYTSHNIDNVQLILSSGFNLDGELYSTDSRFGPVTVSHGGQALFLRI